MKAIRLLLIGILIIFISFSVFADEINPLVYQYTNPEITIVFSDPLQVSSERQQEIADSIACVNSNNTLYESPSDSPDNIICTLFGHDIAPQSTVTATHHKVDKYNPRCLMEVYHVTYCKRCDYTVSELVSSFYIVCCPED
jgi:hypothetical protein